jgi:YVTN family beta-propeller protein
MNWILDTGCWILDARCWIPRSRASSIKHPRSNRCISNILIGLLSFLLIFSLVGCGEDEEEDQAPEASVKAAYIVNGAAETLSVFDIEASEVENDVLTVGKWPADIKIWGDRAYVVNTGDNNIQIIDLESLTDAGLIDIGDGTLPEKIGFVSDSKAYVSCNGTKSVKVVDPIARQATKNIEVGVAPWGVAVVGQKVCVCNTAYDGATNSYGGGTVSVIDSSTDTVVKTIDVELNPTEVAVSGSKILVLCTGNYVDVMGNLCVIDSASDTVVQTIDLGTTPSGIAVSPNGMVYITSFGGLLPVDIDSGSVLAPLEDFAGGSGLAFDRDGNAYICIPDWAGGGNDKLLIMNASENLAGTYSVGGGASIIAVRE